MSTSRPLDREIPLAAATTPAAAMPTLSVILPCYRGASIAERSVATLVGYLSRRGVDYEVLVVDDGGGDFPADAFAGEDRVRLIRLPVNRGKGAAVRAGMLAARGQARIFTDVDLPFDLHLIPAAAHYLLSGHYHMVIGDRTLPTASYEADIGWKRRAASRVFSMFVGTMVTGGFFDTQCGLKGLRGDVADLVFRMSRLERFAFDVELVYLGLHHRLDIKRIPVQLRNNETSSVRVVRDSAQMLKDVLRIKAFQLRGAYDDERLARVVVSDFEAQIAQRESVLEIPVAVPALADRAAPPDDVLVPRRPIAAVPADRDPGASAFG